MSRTFNICAQSTASYTPYRFFNHEGHKEHEEDFLVRFVFFVVHNMPDSILLNANIHTLDSKNPHATALALRDGKIAAVGDDSLRALAGPHTRLVDLEGRTVLPGLTDAHIHFEWYSIGLANVDVETETLAEALRRVAERASATPPDQWIRGHGWNATRWGIDFPTAAQLDSAAPDHPVYLTTKSMHAGWANSAAMRLAGVTSETPDPPGGKVLRDERGAPTGIFLETAMDLITARSYTSAGEGQQRTGPTVEDVARAMLLGQQRAWELGLTSLHDFDGVRCFKAYQLLRERGQLGLRVVKNLPVAYLDHAIALGLRSGFGDDWIRLGNVKVFMDGALGPRTAQMIEPYEGEPENFGIVVTDKEELYEHATKAAQAGLAMTVHAIGDKANHDLLDVYETIRNEGRGESETRPYKALRHRCEHVQVLHPDDWARLGQLNVIASMQPIHAPSDMQMADKHWGARRTPGAYAWRTQLNAGAVLAFGSDAPVENPNPFWGIHAAVTRRRADGTPGQGWHPEQRLTVEEAVCGFTLGAAYAGNMENKIGSLALGKYADLIVIDRDIFACDPMDIKDTQVLRTMVEGKWKYER